MPETPRQGQYPEAPTKYSPDAYVRGAFTTAMCLAISDGLGIIRLSPDQKNTFGQITAQATTRPQKGTATHTASVQASELWMHAAQASLGMFGELLKYKSDHTPRSNLEIFAIYRNALLLTAGITENEANPQIRAKRDLVDKWLQGKLSDDEKRHLAETVLPVWCKDNGGMSTKALSDMSAARALYTKLWNFSYDVDPHWQEKMQSHRR